MTRTSRWSPVSLGLGIWMIWCVVAVAITTIGRPFFEIRELFSVPMVALLLAAGILAVAGGVRPSPRIAAALGAAALALPIATVAAFGERGIVGNDDEGGVLFFDQLEKQIHDRFGVFGVEIASGFIGK